MLRGFSAESLARSQDRVGELAAEGSGDRLGEDLFSVVDVLRSQGALRRALTDPSASAQAKTSLVRSVFGGKVGHDAVEVIATAAGGRWSAAGDMVEALQQLGVLAVVISAEQTTGLDNLEDELFRFGRVVAGDPRLRDAISNTQVPTAHRQQLVRSLLEAKASPAATQLAVRAVASRERSYEAALESFQKVAADRQHRMVAVVRTAIELTTAEHDQLVAALHRMYDRDVHVNVIVDPTVLGGIRVELGDEVIDGTVASRLDEARRRLTA